MDAIGETKVFDYLDPLICLFGGRWRMLLEDGWNVAGEVTLL